MYLIIKDYQIIMEVVYNEAPTSLAYSSNKRSAAMYPLLQCKIPIFAKLSPSPSFSLG